MLMPFGKHKGKAVAEVPVGYLRWLLDNADIRPPLFDAVYLAAYGTPPDREDTLYERLNRIMRESAERRKGNQQR